MKRRAFLAASALLSLFAPSSLLAANKKKGTGAPTSGKPTSTAKPSGNAGRSAGPASAKAGRSSAKASAKGAARRESRRSYRPLVERTSPPPAAVSAPPPIERNAISLPDEPLPQWRTYEVSSTIAVNNVKGKLRVWLPLPQYKDNPWQRSLGHSWHGNFERAAVYRDPLSEMEVFYADWKDGSGAPQLQIVSQIAKQDRHFDITRRGSLAERGEVLRHCLQSTQRVPTDGLVRLTAERAIGRIKDPVAQGKAIYDWVLDNTMYDPSASGIGRGDVEAMLDSGQFSGKSADIALLFVGLCRSIGIPARPVFGLRIDNSRLFAGLGASGNLCFRQHCRAEFYTPGYGWIPVDPADVRKAIHDERLLHADPKLVVLRKLLFGFWEMNWISFNAALDVRLQGTSGRALPFLVAPQAEAAGHRFDISDSSRLSYVVNATRIDG